MAVTSTHAQLIAEAEDKLKIAEIKLSEIERLKAMEKSVRNEVATLTEQLNKLKTEAEFYDAKVPYKKEAGPSAASLAHAGKGYNDSDADTSPRVAAAPAPAPTHFKAPLDLLKTPAETKEDNRKKRIKALVKKIGQVEALKKKDMADLDADGKAKLASEKALREELSALEAGKEYEQEDVETVMLPTDGAEKEKLIKGIKKKLQQIDALKAKGGPLDAEAKAKVESEHRLLTQLSALEKGEVAAHIGAAPEPDLTEQLMKERTDVNRKLKTLNDKLAAIEKLKGESRKLDATEKDKISQEQALKSDKGAAERILGDINKREQARVDARLNLGNDKKKKNKN